jgi:hypothetical protein
MGKRLTVEKEQSNVFWRMLRVLGFSSRLNYWVEMAVFVA